MNKQKLEKAAQIFFLANALLAVVSVLAIAVFILIKGMTPFVSGQYSLFSFLGGMEWRPKQEVYGVFYMLVASILSTAGAILLAIPLGTFTAIYISLFAKPKVSSFLLAAVELLAGIPSVIFGIVGLGWIVPRLMAISPRAEGKSLLAVILVLTMMVLPIVVSLAVTALRGVPDSYKEGSYALGASYTYTVFKVVLPAAKSGLAAAYILGIGRALGETMAVMLVAGNPAGGLPLSLWDKVRPLTTNIALEMSYSVGMHQQMLFSTGVVLLAFIILINLILNRVRKLGDHDK